MLTRMSQAESRTRCEPRRPFSLKLWSCSKQVLQISKHTVESGRVRVSLLTDTEERTVREHLKSRRVDVEHVAVGRQLAAGDPMPQSRIEAGILIVPIVEEVLIVEKRLVVTEELRVRITNGEEEATHVVRLRRQRATVERMSPGAGEPV